MLILVSPILLGPSFQAAQIGVDQQALQKRSLKIDGDSVQLLAKRTPDLARSLPSRQLSLADRVAYQYAIEEVYWRHRIWPGENALPKPSLDEVLSSAQMQWKVEEYLRNSQLLADQWRRPITSKQLQTEMERMARQTNQPEVLRELFAALGNNPFLIAECLARPVLSERLVRERSALDPVESPATLMESEVPETADGPTAGYRLPEIAGPSTSCTDTWTPTSTTNAPSVRGSHSAVWTGNEMIIWGGSDINTSLNTGGRYNPTTDSWVATTTTNAPDVRSGHAALWTGSEMIIWGGVNGQSDLNTGARYNPITDSWVAMTPTNAPAARFYHTAVWTGSEMIVWGGFDTGDNLNTGGRYNPRTDRWVATPTANAPVARRSHTAVWTGHEMIVWGGYNGSSLNTGGRYNPITNNWIATSTVNTPVALAGHTAVWTGREMIVWGGGDGSTYPRIGGRYNPNADSWVATTTINAPVGRGYCTAVWTGREMIVWGGAFNVNYLNTGGRYSPLYDIWVGTTTNNAPVGREVHSAVWTGTDMIIWGGIDTSLHFLNTGGRYCAQAPPTLGNISTRLRVETGDNVLIGGFIITGNQPKKVMVRAIGPSLPVAGVLSDPMLELRDSSGGLIRANDNWRSDQEAEIIATGIPPGNDSESAILETLPANGSAYTTIVRGANNGTGVGLVEVYDRDQSLDSNLANISTRGLVQTGDDVMIAGTIILGQTSLRVLVRAIGPSLPIEGKLADPTVELRDGNGALIRANDNWRSDQEAEIIATSIPPTNDLESAIVATLPANSAAYTAIVRGSNGTTGVALIEIYGLPD